MRLRPYQPYQGGKQRGRHRATDTFRWQHLLAWVGGMLCFLVPFVWKWELGEMQVPVRFGAGNFGYNLLIGTGLCTLGGVVGGYWWRFGQWLSGKSTLVMNVGALLLFALGIWGNFSDITHGWFYYLVGGILAVSIGVAFFVKDSAPRSRQWPGLHRFIDWFTESNRVNAVFYILLLIILLVNNINLVWGMDASFQEQLSAAIGRFFTQGLLVGMCFLLAELSMRSAPRFFRWLPWLVLGLMPMLVVVDQLIGMVWNRHLINVVNALTASGRLDLVVELRTSGLDVGVLGAWLIVAAVFVLAMVVAGGCWLLSCRFRMKTSMAWAIGLSFVCWLGITAEQGIGTQWKKVSARQEERRMFDLHLAGFFAPPMGVGTYRIEFFDHESSVSAQPITLEQRPDIHVLMIESMRYDTLRPDVTPFLCEFRRNECQQFGDTWSASNATHLSWFGVMHSRIPIYWRDALEAIPDRSTYQGAVPLQNLKRAGYEIEVRAVCDLSYKDFGLSNFGLGNSLATVMTQANDGSELEKYGMCEREKRNFDALKQSIKNRPNGGGFYFTAMDAPHYNYYWHDDFDPPFKDFDPDTRFPINPTKDEIQRVVNRYWNACAWVDNQVQDFVEFLKREGRYDNSIIILTGDHGEEFQEQGSWFHCSSLKPEQIRVPLMIKWPKSLGPQPPQKNVSHLDVMPSVFAALNMPAETRTNMAGRNLLEPAAEQTTISTTAFAGKSN
ncbi:MAG: sulfatase-like hydrolase/transferase, partial [Akkermansiaceae bacterium]